MSHLHMIGYQQKATIIHRLSGSTKLLAFISLTMIGMLSFDTRFLCGLAITSLLMFRFASIKYQEVAFTVKFVCFFAVLNLVTIYLFSPEYGVSLYGSRTLIFAGIGRYTLTQEQLFYEANVLLKYVCTIPPAFVFMMTTDPSEFAASLNKIGVPYKISYAVSLALRYLPDVQQEFITISQGQQARGIELSKKAQLVTRVKGNLQIVIPLIFTSLERITTISSAMELRRFGKEKKRTWYMAKKASTADCLVLLVVFLIIGLGSYLFVANQGRFYNPFNP